MLFWKKILNMANWNKTLVKKEKFWYNKLYEKLKKCRRGGMADTRDLKSLAFKAYEFESRWRHQTQNFFRFCVFYMEKMKKLPKRY